MNTTEQIRDELKRRGRPLGFCYGQSGIPGVFTIEATHELMLVPIGVVWYTMVGLQGIQIENSFIDERFRRCGVRTYLHEKLLASYPDRTWVISGGGTKSGQAWMRAAGYKKTKMGWEFKRKP